MLMILKKKDIHRKGRKGRKGKTGKPEKPAPMRC